MRDSKAINREIGKLRKTLAKKEMQTYNLEQRIHRLENTLETARHREELERNGIYVNIVSVERQKDSLGLFLITTDKGLNWLQSKKLKIGTHKITQSWHDHVKEMNEEYRNKEVS